jgi:hypothetical protein
VLALNLLTHHDHELCCCRAKERILAHSKEQQLEIPVIVTERNSVTIEDVASMLDNVLITSSNNADEVCELKEALAAATFDAAGLREEVATLQQQSEALIASGPDPSVPRIEEVGTLSIIPVADTDTSFGCTLHPVQTFLYNQFEYCAFNIISSSSAHAASDTRGAEELAACA